MKIENGKNIDYDVVERILSILLDPKSLMRFKCVSKLWYALITNPMFVAKHLYNSLNNKNSTSVLVRHLVKKNINNSEIEEEVFSLLNFCNNVVNDIHNVHTPLCDNGLMVGGALSIIGHCNGVICLANSISREIILWNPAIHESKLLPSAPYLQDYNVCGPIHDPRDFAYALGFGYDVILNEYKIINIKYSDIEHCYDNFEICHPPKAFVHTLGTDCWREIKTGCFETETSVLWPEQFQVYIKQMCYWLGREHHKELHLGDAMEEEFFRNVIIMFDTGHEIFHYIMLPDFGGEHYYYLFTFHLLVWNESIAFFAYKHSEGRFCMWVLDEELDVIKGVEGAWVKHVDLELYERPLAFWKSDEILMFGGNNNMLSYNLSTQKRKYLPIEDLTLQNKLYDSRAIVYVNSLVTIQKSNIKKKSRENSSTNELVFDMFNHSSLLSHCSMVKKKNSHSYSIWVIPPVEVSSRIKKVMEGLRIEFGGPEIEPHITILGSIRMTYEDVVNNFLSLRSLSWIIGGQPKVNLVVTRNFYYQCVSLELSSQLDERCSPQFNIHGDSRPHLSLFYGYLTDEERKKAKEIVNSLDESICSMSFPLNRIALYKINYNDTSLKSWEKIVEFPLHQEYMFPLIPLDPLEEEDAAILNNSIVWCIGNM